MKKAVKEIVGLVPCAGFANRLPNLPCSKEIYPIGFKTDNAGLQKTKVVSESLLNNFRDAGVKNVYMIIRKGKWDTPFTDFIHNFLLKSQKKPIEKEKKISSTHKSEIFIRDIIQQAIQSGLAVESILFDDGTYTDIGTIEDLRNIISRNC